MIEVRINNKNVTLDLSDEVRDLIDNAVIYAINEEVISKKEGDMDFDIRGKGEFSGDLRISYEVKNTN